MKIEVNQLSVDFTVTNPRIKKAEDLEVHVVFTNASEKQLRLNALFLDFTTIMLKVQKSDGTPVNPGPPPLPPIDDGQTGRIYLEPGQSMTFVYKGTEYFGAPLMPGKYRVQFRYKNSVAEHGDWTGAIETDWLGFEIHR